MTSLANYFRRALELPPHVAFQRGAALGLRYARQRLKRLREHRNTTYGVDVAGSLRWRMKLGDLPAGYAASLANVTSCYMRHRFDLLGSGWVEVRHGMSCAGLDGVRFAPADPVEADPDGRWLKNYVNTANVEEAQRCWRMIRFPYVPIDWQLDFKSGYRWSQKLHFSDIRYGHRRGADVKVPWELARLQHLPQLALAARPARAGTNGFLPPDRYRDEVCNQILDFVATNPPRFGANWSCAMDVAIRVVNMLVAVDLLRDAGAELDERFLGVLRRSVRDHGVHILDNLEWSAEGRGNHYLADIVGLLFAAAYLPGTAETRSWLTFAIREFTVEADCQFLRDGGNFEGSTSYHRLSGEVLLFGAALVLGLGDEMAELLKPQTLPKVKPPQPMSPLPLYAVANVLTPLPPHLFETLARAAALSYDASKPDHHVVQWGDNDSGRLLKLQPVWAPMEGVTFEDLLDHRSFIAGAAALTGGAGPAAEAWIDADVARCLSRGATVAVPQSGPMDHVQDSQWDGDAWLKSLEQLPPENKRRLEFTAPFNLLDHLQRAGYPDFGHYVFRGPRFYLAIRCPHELPTLTGHCHDDALAIELQIDGRDIFTDPGTYVYTPLPDERNRYRHTDAHGAPRPLDCPGPDFSLGLFQADGLPTARCRYFGRQGFVGEAAGAGWTVTRMLLFQGHNLILIDASPAAPLAPFPTSLPQVCWGYGRKTSRLPRIL